MKIEVYGASWCTSCKDVVALCKTRGLEYQYIDVDNSADMRALEARIGTKVRAVPQIFVDDQHLTGFTAFREHIGQV